MQGWCEFVGTREAEINRRFVVFQLFNDVQNFLQSQGSCVAVMDIMRGLLDLSWMLWPGCMVDQCSKVLTPSLEAIIEVGDRLRISLLVHPKGLVLGPRML